MKYRYPGYDRTFELPLDPLPSGNGLPRCICGEEVAMPHKSCLALLVEVER